MLLYRPIANRIDYAQLQEDINTISEWVDGNYLQFNTQKCKLMRVTRNELVSVLQLCISVVSHYKMWTPTNILGSSCHQIYHGHTISKSTCGKARKQIGLIYRYFSNSESLFQMYISLVRPHLEYASQVWNPYKAGEINSLEDVQKFALTDYTLSSLECN